MIDGRRELAEQQQLVEESAEAEVALGLRPILQEALQDLQLLYDDDEVWRLPKGLSPR